MVLLIWMKQQQLMKFFPRILLCQTFLPVMLKLATAALVTDRKCIILHYLITTTKVTFKSTLQNCTY